VIYYSASFGILGSVFVEECWILVCWSHFYVYPVEWGYIL